MNDKHMCVVGAGLCGTLLAIRLAQRGYRVSLFERRGDMRKKLVDAGRSINLAISDRGFKALRMAGLEDEVRKDVIPMHGRMIHSAKGEQWLAPYSGRQHEFINSVSRPGLNMTLLDAAEKMDNVRLYFDHRCEHVNIDDGGVHFKGPSGQEVYQNAEVIFGTDGAGSAVRRSFFERSNEIRFSYSQTYLDHGYKELEIPSAEDGGWRIEKHALHIWPRDAFMLIALPNLDGSFTVTLFLAFEGDPGFNQLITDEDIESFFGTVFPSAKAHMPDLVKDFRDNPASSLGTIRCSPWQMNGNVLLMGDAAHAIVPFYGQGMNCALEDVYVLDGLIDEFDHDWASILPEYEKRRKKDTDAIADLAIENYYEMRDHVDNPDFRAKRQIELKLEAEFNDYSSKYNLVTFNENVPYSRAKALGNRQDQFLLDLYKHGDLDNNTSPEAIIEPLRALRNDD